MSIAYRANATFAHVVFKFAKSSRGTGKALSSVLAVLAGTTVLAHSESLSLGKSADFTLYTFWLFHVRGFPAFRAFKAFVLSRFILVHPRSARKAQGLLF